MFNNNTLTDNDIINTFHDVYPDLIDPVHANDLADAAGNQLGISPDNPSFFTVMQKAIAFLRG